ncbi:MAG: hypothetical protein LIP00_00765, partial [Parabacteroides sp.]|nr:hypothetical protein [Parabacteroides sp.]
MKKTWFSGFRGGLGCCHGEDAFSLAARRLPTAPTGGHFFYLDIKVKQEGSSSPGSRERPLPRWVFISFL